MGIQSEARALRDGRVQETLPRLAWEEHLDGASGPAAAPDKRETSRPSERSASDDIQEGKKVLKLKTETADKENIDNTVEKNCIPLKADEVTSQTYTTWRIIFKPSKPRLWHQTRSFIKDNKKMQATAEKPKQDTNRP